MQKTDVDLNLQDGALVVSRSARKGYVLDEMLAQITPENVHNEMD